MKKNGFTLIEILISLSLASIVMVLLFNIVLTLKNLYIEDGMKTSLLIHTANFNKRLEAISKEGITEVNRCGNTCLNFIFQNGEEKNLSYNKEENTLTIDNYKVKLADGTSVGDFLADTQTITTMENPSYHNSILSIEVPITHHFIEGQYSISLVYPYNTNEIVISVT